MRELKKLRTKVQQLSRKKKGSNNRAKENRKSQEKFVCTACGHSANADINAAKNILVRGIHGNNASLKIAV